MKKTASSSEKLDSVDRSIISALIHDGRTPLQTIARALRVDEKTIRNRVARLKESGMLRIIPVTDTATFSNALVAMIGVRLSAQGRKRKGELGEEFAKLPHVLRATCTMGQYDMVLEIAVPSQQVLSEFELETLSSLEEVESTEGLLVLSTHGQQGIAFIEDILG